MSIRKDGIDLSNWQNATMDFAQAKASGIKFVTHKATESTTYADTLYAKRRAEVGNIPGLYFGAYHFARPGFSDGTTQAQYFLTHAKPSVGDLWPMLDLEVDNGLTPTALTAWAKAFVDEVRLQLGCGAFIYTNANIAQLQSNLGCPLWVPAYSDAMTPPPIPLAWTAYTIWQYSDGVYPHDISLNSVPGIGHCDINHLAGSTPAATLANFIIKAGTP